MISALQEIDSAWPNEVNEAVLLSDAPRPSARRQMLQRLRFSDTVERFSKDRFDEIENLERGSAVLGNPPAKILQKFLLKDTFLSRLLKNGSGRRVGSLAGCSPHLSFSSTRQLPSGSE
jgi:hypothetical protein